MIVWGIALIIVGIGSFIVPRLGMQFVVLTLFGKAAPTIAIIMIFLGVIMTIYGIIGALRRKKEE